MITLGNGIYSVVNSVDIIVPVYNEEEGLESFYARIRSIGVTANLVFIDNASTDRTVEILKSFDDVKLILHDKNEGYGGSINDGIRSTDGEIILIIDADCEYPPEAIPDMLRKFETQEVVYASRFLDHQNENMPLLKRKGNQIISGLFNLLFRQRVTDLYTGCKAFRRATLSGFAMERSGFESVLEMAVHFSRSGYKISEVPVKFVSRQTGVSQMKHVSEVFKYLYFLLRYYVKGKKR